MNKFHRKLISAGIFAAFIVVLGVVTGGCDQPSSDPPMILAAAHGNVDQIKAMVATGADVNVMTQTGYTPLCAACSHNNKEIAEYLIAHRAMIDGTNFHSGYTPLYWAILGDSKEVIKLLLDKGADVNVASMEGRFLALARSPEVIQLLLDKGVAVNVAGDKRLPLHVAAYAGRLDVVKTLLAHGADANATNSWGARPLHEAARSDEPSAAMATLLITSGANVNGLDANRGTPLHMAVMGFTGCMDGMVPFWTKNQIMKDRLKVAEVLLAHRADLNATNAQGQTPLAWAIAEQNSAAVKFLKARGAK